MNDRIVKLMKTEGLTNSKFASILGIQRSNVTHIVDGRNKPSLSFIEKLMSKFPHVNIEWMISGTGEMYKQNDSSESQSSIRFPTVETEQMPEVLPNPVQQVDNIRIPESVQTLEQVINNENPVLEPESDSETLSPADTDVELKSESNTETDFKPDDKPQISQPANIPEQDVIVNSDEKEIEFVLIFYKDKTFKQYKPF
jgi:plasmid maintenance system antidote protein VapI